MCLRLASDNANDDRLLIIIPPPTSFGPDADGSARDDDVEQPVTWNEVVDVFVLIGASDPWRVTFSSSTSVQLRCVATDTIRGVLKSFKFRHLRCSVSTGGVSVSMQVFLAIKVLRFFV